MIDLWTKKIKAKPRPQDLFVTYDIIKNARPWRRPKTLKSEIFVKRKLSRNVMSCPRNIVVQEQNSL